MKIVTRIAIICILLFNSGILGQGMHGGHLNPDSLELTTVSGIVHVDTSVFHPMYYLYTNGNDHPGYILNFGPFWYEPDSSKAVRPKDGDSVNIYGGVFSSSMMPYDMLVVYEINGEFWRQPYEPQWNYIGGYMNMGRDHMNMCNNGGSLMHQDSLKSLTISGTAFVDTTFMFEACYLDTNNDSIPDYMLNFGPPWYQPESGALKPINGEQITIIGAEIKMPRLNMIVVYEINGKTWRDSASIGSHLGGGWMHSSMTQSQKFHCSFDDSDWIMIHPGWHMGGMHGGMMPDSMFVRMYELFPANLPNVGNENSFAAYEFSMVYPSGMQGMGPGLGCGGMMQFNNNSDIQLHYNDIQLSENNIDESTIKAKYYDDSKSSWIEISGAILNTSNKTVTFSQTSVNNMVILSGQKSVTGVLRDKKTDAISEFKLMQNYPNPFNPSTNFEFHIAGPGFVSLEVYGILGNKIASLVNNQLAAGDYKIKFDGSNLASGIYFYKLSEGTFSQTKKFILLK